MSSTGVFAFSNIILWLHYNLTPHFYWTPVKVSVYVNTGVVEGSVVAEWKDAAWSSRSPTFFKQKRSSSREEVSISFTPDSTVPFTLFVIQHLVFSINLSGAPEKSSVSLTFPDYVNVRAGSVGGPVVKEWEDAGIFFSPAHFTLINIIKRPTW